MKKTFLTLVTLFLSIGFSATAFAHAGHSDASVMHLLLHSLFHIAATVSIFLSLMAAALFIYKRMPKAIQQRVKK